MANEVTIHVKGKDDASAVLGNVKKSATGLGSALGDVAKIAGGFVLAQGLSKLPGVLTDALGAAQNLAAGVSKLTRETGLSNEESSKLIHTFKHYGLESSDASKSLGILSKKLKGVQDDETGVLAGGKSTVALLADMGVKALDASGNLAPMSIILPQVSDVFKKMPDGMEKTGLAMQLFGKSGKDMIPVLNLGSEGLKKMGIDAERLGVVMDEKAVQSAKNLTYAQRDMHEAMTGLNVMIGGALIPVMTNLALGITNVLVAVRPLISEGIEKLTSVLGPLFDKLAPIFESMVRNKDVIAAVGAAIGGILVIAFYNLAIAAGTAAIAVIAATWPIIAIGVAIGAIITIIVQVIKHWDDITAAVGRAKDMFMSAPAPIKILATALALPLVPIIAIGVGINQLATNWDSAWRGIKSVTQSVINTVISVIANLLGAVAKVLGGLASVADKIPDWVPGAHAVKEALHGMANAAADAASGIQGLSVNLLGSVPAFNGVTNAGWNAFNALKNLQSVSNFNIRATAEAPVRQGYHETLIAVNAELDKNIGLTSQAASAADYFAPSIDDVSAAGGGAAEVFRGLDPDLAALRDTMRNVAEQGVAVLTGQLSEEKTELGSLEQELTAVNAYHDAVAEHINSLNDSISGVTETMNIWKSTSIQGTKGFSDQAFALSQQMDTLQLKINDLDLQKIGLDPESAKAKTLDEKIHDLGDTMAELRLKASNLQLKENLELGPARRDLEELFNPKVEASFAAIVAGFSSSKKSLEDLTGQLVTWNGAQVDAEKLQSYLTTRIDSQKTVIDNLRTAYDDLTATLTSGGPIDDAIKKIWEARGPDLVTSIEGAFVAIDRGDKAAADAAMADAMKLFDEIKSKFPETELGFLAPIEAILKTASGNINVDIKGMTESLGGDLGEVQTAMSGVKEKVAGGFEAMMSNMRDWIVTELWHISAMVNYLPLLDDIRITLGDVLTAIGNIHLEAPSAQHGAAVLKSGLVNVHAGELIGHPSQLGGAASSGAGRTEIHMHVMGSILSERDIERVIADALRHGKFRGQVVI